MWVKNYDMASIYDGYTADELKYKEDESCIMIQVFDDGCSVSPPEGFERIVNSFHQYEFNDIDAPFDGFEHCIIDDGDAKSIASVLLSAKKNGQNVIVHCFAGVSRSGAIVQAAIDIGFKDPETYRAPNDFVYSKIKQYIEEMM